MRTKYLPTSPRGPKQTSPWWLRLAKVMAVLGLIFLLAIQGQVAWSWTTGPALALAKPLWRVEGYLGASLGGLGPYFQSKRFLTTENQGLQQKIAELEGRLLDRQVLVDENRSLREALGQTDPAPPGGRLVRVISSPWRSPYDTVVVDVGGQPAGTFRVGDWALGAGSVLLGRVAELAGGSAKIQLLSAAKVETPVVIGAAGVQAVAVGRGGGNFVSRLPRGVDIAVGSAVTVALPETGQALLLGKVGAVAKDESDSLQSVLFRTPLNLQQLNQLEIIAHDQAPPAH